MPCSILPDKVVLTVPFSSRVRSDAAGTQHETSAAELADSLLVGSMETDPFQESSPQGGATCLASGELASPGIPVPKRMWSPFRGGARATTKGFRWIGLALSPFNHQWTRIHTNENRVFLRVDSCPFVVEKLMGWNFGSV